MKRLPIDFAPPTAYRVVSRIHPAAWLLIVAATTAGMHAGISIAGLRRQQAVLSSDLQRMQSLLAERTSRQHVKPPLAISETQARAVNAAVAQLNLPWRDLLDAIEAATPPTIALLSIEPDAGKHLVKGMAEAKTSDAMIAYIEELKRQPFFTLVALTHHEINTQDPNKPIRFRFEAQWEERP